MTTPGILNTYTVTPQVALLGQIAAGSMIYNSDTVNAIYVGPSSATTATNGLRIGPLGSVTWTLDAPCYALSSAGSVQVIVTSNASDLSSPLDIALALEKQATSGLIGSWNANGGTFTIPTDISKYQNLLITVLYTSPWQPTYNAPSYPPSVVSAEYYIDSTYTSYQMQVPIDSTGNINNVAIPSIGNRLVLTSLYSTCTITLSYYNNPISTYPNMNIINSPLLLNLSTVYNSYAGNGVFPVTGINSSSWFYGTNSTPVSYPNPYPVGNCSLNLIYSGIASAAEGPLTLNYIVQGFNAVMIYSVANSGMSGNVIFNYTMPSAPYLIYITMPPQIQATHYAVSLSIQSIL